MAAVSSTYRRPRGFVIALMVLGGIDLLLNLGNATTATVALAAQGHTTAALTYSMSGLTGAILLLQVILRVPQLVVRSLWARRLVANIHLFQRFPVSPTWAWAGFFVPVASLWLPGRTALALARTSGPRNSLLDGLCLVWAVARWLNCPSGGGLVFVTYALIYPHWRPGYSLMMVLTLEIIGVFGSALGIVLTPWITRRQPAPDQLDRAEVFA